MSSLLQVPLFCRDNECMCMLAAIFYPVYLTVCVTPPSPRFSLIKSGPNGSRHFSNVYFGQTYVYYPYCPLGGVVSFWGVCGALWLRIPGAMIHVNETPSQELLVF